MTSSEIEEVRHYLSSIEACRIPHSIISTTSTTAAATSSTTTTTSSTTTATTSTTTTTSSTTTTTSSTTSTTSTTSTIAAGTSTTSTPFTHIGKLLYGSITNYSPLSHTYHSKITPLIDLKLCNRLREILGDRDLTVRAQVC